MEKENLYSFSQNNKKQSLIRENNYVLIDFHKTKQKLNWSVAHGKNKSFVLFSKPQKFKSNT